MYTEPVDYGVSEDETESRARALIDQWGIGRKGFDDGMVVFFDIDPSGEHGQVQLYAAPGFEATYLTNEDRQKIFDDDMVPFLRNADFDGALDVAMRRIDAAATPENAAAPATRPPGQRGDRAGRGADRVPRARPAGRSSRGVATARTRSTSTTHRS